MILGAIFGSSAKTLRGRKDTLAQVYFYWGAIAPRDRRHWLLPVFGGLTTQVDWLGLRVGGHPALSLHSSD